MRFYPRGGDPGRHWSSISKCSTPRNVRLSKNEFPPDPQIRKGRPELFEFFAGDKGRPKAVSILWHHLIFDPASQIGAGEFTFTYEVRTHGMVILRIVNGKIANWREYEIESRMNWEEMVGENRF